MLTRIQIENFQSLHKIDLTLAPLTVIVGKSSSGKSAFARALRTLASNRRGTEWITQNQQTAKITGHTDHGSVTLTRSRSTSASLNSYELALPDQDPLLYTKLGGDVPEAVTKFLGIEPKNPIQFAGQFDKPFLLDESSAESARVLGALTNIDVVMAGAREANRQRLSESQTLKQKSQELETITARIPEFKKVTEQSAALDIAEQLITKAYELQQQIAKLSRALEDVQIAAGRIKQLQASVVVVPDISLAQETHLRVLELKSVIDTVIRARDRYVDTKKSTEDATDRHDEALRSIAAYREEIGDSLVDIFKTRSQMSDEGLDLIEVETAAGLAVDWLDS